MFEDDVTVPAGWYPDPMGLPQLRWWNNHAWTELTTEARPPLVMQQPVQQTAQQPTRLAYADEELPTRRQQREQREREARYARLATETAQALSGEPLSTDPLATEAGTEHEPVPPQAPLDTTLRQLDASTFTPRGTSATLFVGDEDAIEPGDTVGEGFTPRSATTAVNAPTAQNAMAGQVESETVPTTARSSARQLAAAAQTPAVWIIALLPLVQLVVSLLLLLGVGAALSPAATAVLWLGPYVLTVLLAIADRSMLRTAGAEHTAHWAFAFLTAPIYLIVRSAMLSRDRGGFSLGPLLVWAALGMLQLGSVLVVPGILISTLPGVFANQAEQSVMAEATVIGADLQVSCPDTPPVLVGQTFDCSAKAAGGAPHDVVVSLQRVNGWIDWRVDDWGVYTLER